MPPEEILLSILREGDIFGELSIVSDAPRSATAISAAETALLPVSRASLPSVFGKSPATVARILAALSQRLWFTFIRLRAKLDGCLTGCRLAKDRAADGLTKVMTREALDYPA